MHIMNCNTAAMGFVFKRPRILSTENWLGQFRELPQKLTLAWQWQYPRGLSAGMGKLLFLKVTPDGNPWSPKPESPRSAILKLKYTLLPACNSSPASYRAFAETLSSLGNDPVVFTITGISIAEVFAQRAEPGSLELGT